MDAYLFEGAPAAVQILPEAVEVGGSWEGHPQTDPAIAQGQYLVECVYHHLKALDHPVLVDVGANTGSFSLLPVLIPDLTVLAFEPNRAVYGLLERHLEMNHLLDRVFPFCQAAWNVEANLLLSVPYAHATGCATLGKPSGYAPVSQQVVPAFPLDALLKDNLPRIDLLKIDVEGAEKFVLQGAEKLIARYRPVLLVECTWATGLLFDYDRQDILNLIESYGYSYTFPMEDNAWCVPL